MKICFLSDHHISYNPRLWKEAFFYEQQGYEVIIKVMWISETALARDREILTGHNIRYESYLNLVPGNQSALVIFLARLRKRFFVELQRFTGISKQWTLSYAPERMYRAAIKENADYYSAHLESAFYVGAKLIRSGKKVFFDFEDWYSRDYLVAERPVKLLAQAEKFALDNSLFCTAASQSMKEGLIAAYGGNKEIEVVYNGFPSQPGVKGINNLQGSSPRLLWFSRNIGPARGLEKFVSALHSCIRPVELHLLGEMTRGYRETISSIFSDNIHSLHFHDFIPHKELHAFISGFTIGLAIEEKINDNRDLTVTNKMLQYLQAGIKVFATDTKGQMEVAAHFKGGIAIVDSNDSSAWANTLQSLIAEESNQENIMRIFNSVFSWEAQEIKLKKLAQQYL